nr:bifunctional hydroxymethylpyrimidine kinase/phosphomethylpyrimidine kinase [Candidatus Njordarchaeota archaeon]
MRTVPCALTIAGSDSGGGAGIQADLKTFAALGVHGLCVITSVTAQNTVSVEAIQDIDPKVIEAQLDAVVQDIGVDAAKTGMLHTTNIIDTVAGGLKKYGFPVVIDPVMVAKGGAKLLEEDAVAPLVERLFPLATVVVPNIFEAEFLSKMKINDIHDVKVAASRILELGPKAVLVKGGHLEPESNKAVDLLLTTEDSGVRLFEGPRYNVETTHGTGCSFSAAVAAELAKGKGVSQAVNEAKLLISDAIKHGLRVGQGHGPVNPMIRLYRDAEKFRLSEDLKEAVRILEGHPEVAKLVPESQMNIGVALTGAENRFDVLAIPGRIVKVSDSMVRASSCPEFGASSHVSNTILAVMKHDASMRAAMNIRCSKENLDTCRSIGLSSSSYDRRQEPPAIKETEGATILWGAEQAIGKLGKVPDTIYHAGDWGKEPMILILGRSAVEVARKAVSIAEKSV